MRLVMTLLVRDEVDVVRQNIGFHLAQGVDHVIAIDNGSTDGTREILAGFEDQGLATVIDEPRQNYAQSEWVTAAAVRARVEHDADWIVNVDADEFWLSPYGDLKRGLDSTSASKLICRRLNMLWAFDDERPVSWLAKARFRVRNPVAFTVSSDIFDGVLPAPYLYLDLPPKVLLRASGLRTVAQGNHDACYDSEVADLTSDIRIYHYPVRSAKQFRRKVLQGGRAYARNRNLSPEIGWHWRRWHHRLVVNGLESILSDALPSSERLQNDLDRGILIHDETMFSHIPEI